MHSAIRTTKIEPSSYFDIWVLLLPAYNKIPKKIQASPFNCAVMYGYEVWRTWWLISAVKVNKTSIYTTSLCFLSKKFERILRAWIIMIFKFCSWWWSCISCTYMQIDLWGSTTVKLISFPYLSNLVLHIPTCNTFWQLLYP